MPVPGSGREAHPLEQPTHNLGIGRRVLEEFEAAVPMELSQAETCWVAEE